MDINLNSVVGCMCEVKTMDNEFLALGKIGAFIPDNNSIEIFPYDDGGMPSAKYETKVKVNVFSSKHGFLGLEGFVYIAHSNFWRLYDVSSLGANERRSYFRIKTSSHAIVEQLVEQAPAENGAPQPAAPKYPCIVTSISISGVLIAVDDESCHYQLGSTLMVDSFSVGESSQLFTVKCRVRRIDHHQKLGKLFGCEFVDLTEKDIEKLCQAIFAQQRLEIQRKRGIH